MIVNVNPQTTTERLRPKNAPHKFTNIELDQMEDFKPTLAQIGWEKYEDSLYAKYARLERRDKDDRPKG